MSSILVCIPTLTGREDYLANAIRGYRERSGDHDIRFSIEYNAPSCGVGWQRCVNLSLRPGMEYIHFSNDDIVVAEGWADPLIEVAAAGMVGAARMEPAGVACDLDPMPIPPPMPPLMSRSKYGYFYSDLAENQPQGDGEFIDHCSLPFMAVRTFYSVGPCIPIHFGTDKWLCRDHIKHPTVARQGSVIFNYAAQVGRSREGWEEMDFIDFDLCVAYPRYLRGELEPTQVPPERLTPEGLRLVQAVRAER